MTMKIDNEVGVSQLSRSEQFFHPGLEGVTFDQTMEPDDHSNPVDARLAYRLTIVLSNFANINRRWYNRGALFLHIFSLLHLFTRRSWGNDIALQAQHDGDKLVLLFLGHLEFIERFTEMLL